MSRRPARSFSSRYDELAERGSKLVGARSALQPTPVHRRAVRIMQDLLELATKFSNPDSTPQALRVALRMLRQLEPMLLEEMATVPDMAIVEFLVLLRNEIDEVICLVPALGPATTEHHDPSTTDDRAALASGA